MIPDHGNRQKRCTLFESYLLEYEWIKCQTNWDQETTTKLHKPPRDIKHQLTRPFAIASNNAHIGQNSIWWFPGNRLEYCIIKPCLLWPIHFITIGSLSKLTRWRPTCKFLFRRTQGQVNSVGPWHPSLRIWIEICLLTAAASVCLSSLIMLTLEIDIILNLILLSCFVLFLWHT